MTPLEATELAHKIVKRWGGNPTEWEPQLAGRAYRNTRQLLNDARNDPHPPHLRAESDTLMSETEQQAGLEAVERLRAVWASRGAL